MAVGQPSLRVHGFISSTLFNGPGLRASLWVQGCSLGCPGCFNPETHTFSAGTISTVDEVFSQIVRAEAKYGIDGLTVSGGEPFQQRHALLPLLARVRAETGLSIIVFSGYTWDEIASMRGTSALLANIDVLICGRYDERLHLADGMRGSANKVVHLLTSRYRMSDIKDVPRSEVIIDEAGDVVVTGIDPLRGRLSEGGQGE